MHDRHPRPQDRCAPVCGRNIFIGLAILLGVSFVSGSFVLADSMKATFNNLFTELNEDVDLEVRAELTGVDETEADA